MSDDAHIWIDPRRHAGAPCVGGTRLPVATIARAVWRKGGSVQLATESYPCTRAQVLVACWYQVRYGTPLWRKRWGAWATEHDDELWYGKWDQIPDPPGEGWEAR